MSQDFLGKVTSKLRHKESVGVNQLKKIEGVKRGVYQAVKTIWIKVARKTYWEADLVKLVCVEKWDWEGMLEVNHEGSTGSCY